MGNIEGNVGRGNWGKGRGGKGKGGGLTAMRMTQRSTMSREAGRREYQGIIGEVLG